MNQSSVNQITDKKPIRTGLSLYKTGRSPYWFAQIWVGAEKKYYRKSTKETSRIEAAKVAEEVFESLKNQKVSFASVVTKQLCNTYIDELINLQRMESGKGKSSRYARDDENLINRVEEGIRAYFGRRDISKITTKDIRTYFLFLDSRRDVPLAPSTRNKYRSVLSKLFRLAYEEGAINKPIIMPKFEEKRDNPRPSFNDDEYKHLLDTIRKMADSKVRIEGMHIDNEFYYFVVFLTASFMRPVKSEIFNIRYRDIEVHTNPDYLEIRVTGKTGYRSVRTMPNAVDYFIKLRDMRRPKIKEKDFLFFNHFPNRNTARDNAMRCFDLILREANLKKTKDGQNRSLYSLRHYSLQTRLIKSKGKVNIFVLAKNAGTSVNQLERFYLRHLDPNDDIVKNLQTFGN